MVKPPRLPNYVSVPPGSEDDVPDWGRLKFNPLGLHQLRRRLGVLSDKPGVFHRYQERFLHADIAWFAAGCHKDGLHSTGVNVFHSSFDDLRASDCSDPQEARRWRTMLKDRARELLFDVATLIDRAFGSTTLIVQMEGTTIPGLAAMPENLRAHVYLPPVFIAETPDLHRPIAVIIQQCIEHLGVETVLRWRRATHAAGWTFSSDVTTPKKPHAYNYPLVPSPLSGSAHYVFRGRPTGILIASLPSAHAPTLPPSVASHASSSSPTKASRKTKQPTLAHVVPAPEQFDTPNETLLQYLQECKDLQAELAAATDREAEQADVIDALQSEMQLLARQSPSTQRPPIPVSATRPPVVSSSQRAMSFVLPSQRTESASSSLSPSSPDSLFTMSTSTRVRSIAFPQSPSAQYSHSAPRAAHADSRYPSTRPGFLGRTETSCPTPFGVATSAAVEHLGIDAAIHNQLHMIADQYVPREWTRAVSAILLVDDGNTLSPAQEIVTAMLVDLANCQE